MAKRVLCLNKNYPIFTCDLEANGQITDENYASALSARSACPVEVIDIEGEIS